RRGGGSGWRAAPAPDPFGGLYAVGQDKPDMGPAIRGVARTTFWRRTMRFAAFMGVFVLGLAAYGVWGYNPGPGAVSGGTLWSRLRANAEEKQRLEAVHQGMNRFWELHRQTKAAVLDGSLSLADAADRLTKSAREDDPCVLTGSAVRFPERTE